MKEYIKKPREEAYDKIEFYMLQNQLKPHDRLPSERKMCELWGFNRVTLRSAIERLVLEGKLYQKKGTGTFVALPKLVRNLHDVKSTTESVQDEGRKLETIILDKRIVESNKQISKELRVTLGHNVLQLVRLRIIDGIPAIIDSDYLDVEKYKNIEEHDFANESLFNVLRSYGDEMEEGNEKIGITFAYDSEADWLRINEGDPLFYLTGSVLNKNGEVIDYFKTIARPDVVKFSSKLIR